MPSPVGSVSEYWPADQVERRSIDCLFPYARNARTHSDEQVAQLAASIREWGWTVPVLVDEQGGLIAGHRHVLAERKLDVAVLRWQAFTGKQAVLENNGRTFSETSQERLLTAVE